MSQQDAIESFRIMSQNYKGQALAGLITQITQHPRVFQFTEILQCNNIKNLENGELSKYFKQLQLFAYQNYPFWLKNKAVYPELTNEHIKKLRQLTIIDLCTKNTIVPYELLKLDLGLQNDQEIDTLLIESTYEGIINGKINQKERVFKVNSCISRDIREEDIAQIKQKLNQIYQKNKKVQQSLEERIDSLNLAKKQHIKQQQEFQEELVEAQKKGDRKKK